MFYLHHNETDSTIPYTDSDKTYANVVLFVKNRFKIQHIALYYKNKEVQPYETFETNVVYDVVDCEKHRFPCPELDDSGSNVRLLRTKPFLQPTMTYLFGKYGKTIRFKTSDQSTIITTCDREFVQSIFSDESLYTRSSQIKRKDMETYRIAKLFKDNNGGQLLTYVGTNDEEFKHYRKNVEMSLAFKMMKKHIKNINEFSDTIIADFKVYCENREYFDITKVFNAINIDIILENLISYSDDTFIKGTEHILVNDFKTLFSGKCKDPEILTNTMRRIKKYFRDFVVERREHNIRKDDIMQIMVDDMNLNDEDIVSLLIAIFLGGGDTPSHVMIIFLYLLTFFPKIERKIMNEIKEVVGMDSDTIITFKHLNKLTYLQQCMDEILRINPPFQFINREAMKDTSYLGNSIKKDSILYFSIQSLHSDPEIWGKDVDEFNPDRFEPNVRKERETKFPGSYYPFGFGKRKCPGQNYTHIQSKLLIVKILQNFKLRTKPQNDRYDISKVGMVKESMNEIFVQLFERKV